MMWTNSPLFWLALSLGLYLLGARLYKRWPFFLFNPLLFSVLVLILILKCTGVSYETYQEGGRYLSFLLTPATVSLAVNLEKHYDSLKRFAVPILSGIALGLIAHSILLLLLAQVFRLDPPLTASLLPKSITTAIAIEVSNTLGGIPSLTVAVVVLTGVLGNVFGERILKGVGVTDPVARGLALGASSHILGTSRAMEMGETEGAMATLATVLSGILIVFLTPVLKLFM